VFTIGHSNRTFEEFADLLAENGIDEIVDVRRLPGSNRYPQFDQAALAAALAERGVEYRRIESLTGRRNVSKDVPFEVDGWWENRSFHNYADHALGEDFAEGLAELLALGAEERAAVMCSEAVWWRCHRRIIADHVLAHDVPVQHIMGPGKTTEAQLSAGAVVEDGQVTYPEV